MILMASHVTGYLRNGKHPKPSGNRTGHATSMAYQTAEGMVMLGASNLRQQKRLWTVLERPDLIKRTNDERDADHDREERTLTEIMLTRTAAEWEEFLQERHVPASRVRTMGEALDDPQLASRGLLHRQRRRAGHRRVRSPFPSPPSSSAMTARAWIGRRRCSASTMMRSWLNSATAQSDIAGFRSAKII